MRVAVGEVVMVAVWGSFWEEGDGPVCEKGRGGWEMGLRGRGRWEMGLRGWGGWEMGGRRKAVGGEAVKVGR